MDLLPDVGLRQCLRAHRDGEHHRPARTRRPPRGLCQRGPRRPGPPGLGGPAAPDGRGGRARPTAPRWPRASGARSGSGASRWPASTRATERDRSTAGSTPATRATSTRRAISSSTAGSTTSSSGAARTSRRGRSRPYWWTTRPWTPPPWSGYPTPTGGRRSSPPWCRPTARSIDEEGLRDFVRATLRSTRTPERIEIRDDLPYNETGKLLRRVLREELAARFG